VTSSAALAADLAADLDSRIRSLPAPGVGPVRSVRREFTRLLRDETADVVISVADAVVDAYPWVAYELIHHHGAALRAVTPRQVVRLARRLADWGTVDAFGTILAGPAWRVGALGDEVIAGWARSPDRWWRRAALVATVALNVPARGGFGDPARTLAVCATLVDDRDDMVVKAMSWALRSLVDPDAQAVRDFLDRHRGRLPARVTREVTNKLTVGLKNPARKL
jgi:3-methyladenine DNA glycosylase AlkD